MKATTMRSLRQWHHYLGVFFAPMIIFFAFTGAMQTFSLHEPKGYGGAAAPKWIAWMASVHKDQAPLREKKAGSETASPRPAIKSPIDQHDDDHPAPTRDKGPSPLPLKLFVLLLAVSLISSTLLGVTIALNNRTTRRTSVALLLVGAALPCVLLWL